MYKAITSFWSKSPNRSSTTSDDALPDEDSWVIVSKTESSVIKNNNPMTNSWIASPPLIKTDEGGSSTVHHFNPIENLLIEHASMSVYEQIASKTRQRRQKKLLNDSKLDEQTEEEEEEEDDDDTKTSMNINPQTMNSSVSTLETSTSSLVAHHRHLNRLHYRRKRSNESKQILNKNLERQRLNLPRTSKILLQQTSR